MKRLFIPAINILGKRILKKRFTEPPIYIGGCGRSGTTLLLSVLSAHKEIFAIPRELNIFKNAHFEGNALATPYFYRLHRAIVTHKIKRTANRYCEKSPVNILNVDLIQHKHQDMFKLIQIIRDGRDVILSRHPKRKDDFWIEPERWINDVSTGMKYMQHPNVLTIKYEDLVIDYDSTTQKICKFLNIDWSDEIQNWHKHTTVRKNNALPQKIKVISADSIGRFKNPQYTERVKLLTDNPTGKMLLKKLNYL